VSHHIIFITACAPNVLLLHKLKWRTLTLLATARSVTADPERLTVDASVHFMDVWS